MAAAAEKDVEQSLPPVVDGEMATVLSIKVMERKTRAPTPYTEGQLVIDMAEAGKFLENDENVSAYRKVLKQTSGLGTSATRDSIIENLKQKGFLETFMVKIKGKDVKHIRSTKKGKDLIAYLPPRLYDIATTARWEADLALVEVQGGGPALEAAVVDETIKMVATLKTHGRMKRSEKPITQTKEKSSMSDNQERSTSKPTEKMLEYATKIAKAINLPAVPDNVLESFEECKKFIDDNKEAANRPSEKQLNFARSIATKKGLTIPDTALADAREISKWIDENK
jgi:DNA topoisomerase-3